MISTCTLSVLRKFGVWEEQVEIIRYSVVTVLTIEDC